MIGYLDLVGKMHTPQAGSAELDVPLVQMNALLGFVADALTATILNLGLERACEQRTLRAFNKLLWLQNDLINRHYQAAEKVEPVETGAGAVRRRARDLFPEVCPPGELFGYKYLIIQNFGLCVWVL